MLIYTQAPSHMYMYLKVVLLPVDSLDSRFRIGLEVELWQDDTLAAPFQALEFFLFAIVQLFIVIS